jgi:RNA polymerase sigma factor (sigma-70 family)
MSDKTPSEAELLRACIKGDTTAFAAIVEEYQHLVCAITYSATTDMERSEELAHEAFIKAWINLSQLRDMNKFRAWLCVIVQNVIRNYYRSKKRDIVSRAGSLEEKGDIASESFKGTETIIDNEQQAVIRQALEQIPEKYRMSLVLFYRQGQSIKEVAEILELSEGAVRTQISRGRKMLREEVAAMVETTISRTGPGKAFTAAVVASAAGLAIKGSAAAAGAAATVIGGGKAAIFSGVTAKVITAAAVVIVGAGAVVAYKQVNKPKQVPDLPQAKLVTQRQEKRTNDTENIFTETTNKTKKSKSLEAEVSKETHSKQDKANNDAGDYIRKQGTKTGVEGFVIDKSTSKPIEGANIFNGTNAWYDVNGQPKELCLTDANGRFEVINMQPQERQHLYIVANNYTSRQITLDIIKGKVYENLKIELTPGSRVAGIVSDQNGNPAKGAQIAGEFDYGPYHMFTDANGFFEIDGLDPAYGRYSLNVYHPNYPSLFRYFSPAPAGETVWQDIVLKPGITIYGRVTDAEGNPISGVEFSCNRARHYPPKMKTDSTGEYELRNIDTGYLLLCAFDNEHAPYVERFSLDDTVSEKLMNIQMADSVPLHGKVIDKQGNPISGVEACIYLYEDIIISPSDPNDLVITDSEGRFTLRNAPPEGKVTLELSAEFIPSTMFEVEIGLEKEYIIEVERVGRIYGKVLNDCTDEPIRKFNVKIDPLKWTSSNILWEEGHYFDSAEGFFDTGTDKIPIGAEYSMTVYADGFEPLTIDPVFAQPNSDEPNRIEFRLKPAAAISGKVVDINGVPIVGARIRTLSNETYYEGDRHGDDKDTTFTDSKGRFSADLSLQEEWLYITAETFAPYFCSISDLPRNSEGTIQITLVSGGGIFGRVFDANGEGVNNVKVGAEILGRPKRSYNVPWLNFKQTTTDIEGYYEMFDLPTGLISISVDPFSAGGNRNIIAHKEISLKAGQIVEFNLGKDRRFTICGIVRADEKPLENARVEVVLPSLPNETYTLYNYTDNDGRFRFEGVPKGSYNIYVSYDPSLDQKTYYFKHGQQFPNRRQVVVEGDVELDIDLSDVSSNGKIHSNR